MYLLGTERAPGKASIKNATTTTASSISLGREMAMAMGQMEDERKERTVNRTRGNQQAHAGAASPYVLPVKR